MAGVRDLLEASPQAAVDFILACLEQGLPPGGALYDEDACTAKLLEALGLLRPREPRVSVLTPLPWPHSLPPSTPPHCVA